MTPADGGRRTGRRPGDSGAREAILTAARHAFGTVGYGGATIRGIARAAAVDPALVHHYFATKEQLFVAALELPVDPTEVVPRLVEEGRDGLGERLARTFLGVWDATPGQGPMLALLRSAVSDPAAAQSFRDFLTRVVLEPLARACGPSETAPLRASLAASQLLGAAMARYVVGLEPLASSTVDELAPRLGAALDVHLAGPEPTRGSGPTAAVPDNKR
ncbi:MAG: Transcriptional regulator, AcrR family [uncultured Nocardioidaceae bacterium]|uniref:Transcriptional regulator, AcrR family n=1 Tax=uncultured Nocardioidaceae bacterium TaxID=253824 RepID=A0A6J4LSD3_9ACTN|nr:MAG: Transcriptional regulator, AcrR family [uncultured Nocardioidaceae bacterium]